MVDGSVNFGPTNQPTDGAGFWEADSFPFFYDGDKVEFCTIYHQCNIRHLLKSTTFAILFRVTAVIMHWNVFCCILSHIEYIYLRLPSKEKRVFFLTKLIFSRTPSRPWAPGTHFDEISKQTIGKYLPIIVCGKLSDEGGWGIGRSDQEWAGKVGRFQAAGELGAGEGLEFRWMSSLLRLFKYHWVHLQLAHHL